MTILLNGVSYTVDLSTATDISLGIKREGNVNAYYLDEPTFEPFRAEGFTGSIAEGGSVNCEKLTFYPHGNGTHTECVRHIANLDCNMLSMHPDPFLLAEVVSVNPHLTAKQDFAITLESLEHIELHAGVQALVVRTMPNDTGKPEAGYSGKNPVYFEPSAILWMKERHIKHLLTDLPSVDPEIDGGQMLAHREFFHYPKDPDLKATITELIYVPDSINDGTYLLNLQTPSIETDAVPSRPLLFKMS
ncbi:MAG: cyclase family protein [Bacteroidia bacterium]|nr:cyclase family protein [Bacteroidia bacterium]